MSAAPTRGDRKIAAGGRQNNALSRRKIISRLILSRFWSGFSRAAIAPDTARSCMLGRTPLFVRGDYDTAVFRAFKEVEVGVRKKSGLGKEHFGRGLTQRAFLAHHFWTINMRCEIYSVGRFLCAKIQQAIRKLSSPREVVDMICFANQLLRIVDRLVVRP